MIYDLYEVARQLQSDAPGAIARWEQNYSDQIAQVAELVVENRTLSPVVLLSGPSAASKTSSGRRLRDLLIARKIPAHLVSMDNYYLPWSAPEFPMTSDGQRDLEAPGCLDIPLLNEHFAMLEQGKPIDIPIYSFPTHSRLEGAGLRMYLDVALYVKHKDDSLHWQAIVGEFAVLHLADFFYTVMNACRVWFGTKTICPLPEPDTEALDRLLSYTLDSDLFGHSRDHAIIELRNEKDEAPSRSRVLRKTLFPSAAEIEPRYTFLQNRHWLLPLAWLVRLFANLRLVPSRIRQMKQVTKTDKASVETYDGFMRRIGLGPDNLGQAVSQLAPWGVDLSSGVETDGFKDKTKVFAAVQAVRSTL